MGHGFGRKRRSLHGRQLRRLVLDLTAENAEKLEAIADARRVSIVSCVDEMIEADWQKRHRVPRETPISSEKVL